VAPVLALLLCLLPSNAGSATTPQGATV